MLVEFGNAGLIGKARQQPEKVRMVLEKVRTDGILPTLEAVLDKLDQPLALGYCNVGVVMDVGREVRSFSIGDRVVSNGKHAEVVSVGSNLCVKIPDTVSDDQAAFAVVGAIGLQGIRLVQPTLGEAVVVTGLGLIGLMTVQLLRAHGCRVLGIDYDLTKLNLARKFGAEVVNLSEGEDPITAANAFSRGRGVDAVLITASTDSNEPVHQAATMCRKRGRIVLVGVTGLELSRADFYAKELSFQVSCSYGPGRYDSNYEEKGIDYPIGFVRWTEQRNLEAVLDMIADGRLDVKPLISHRFPIDQAEEAYTVIAGEAASLGILLEYAPPTIKPDLQLQRTTVRIREPSEHRRRSGRSTNQVLGFIGAGNYATRALIPAFKKASARLKTIASNGGVTGLYAGRKFSFEETTTDTDSVIRDPEITALVISTRHDTHSDLVERGLRAGKHVFVEKPLALSLGELEEITRAYRKVSENAPAPLLMVGFNRRFAPLTRKMKALAESVQEPKVLVVTVNAGNVPTDHWTQDALIGGGRIIGEACHFVDLMRFLIGSPIVGFEATSMGQPSAGGAQDKASITLKFQDGSVGALLYLANGHKSFPKERVEVFAGGRILKLDNFRKLTGYGWPGFSQMRLLRQNKGQAECAAAFLRAIEGGQDSPIPFDQLVEVSKTTIEIAAALR
jgi:predicted dehydrogenase/threonine dehydrogenase-like Zn-dependent dehydrogenase